MRSYSEEKFFSDFKKLEEKYGITIEQMFSILKKENTEEKNSVILEKSKENEDLTGRYFKMPLEKKTITKLRRYAGNEIIKDRNTAENSSEADTDFYAYPAEDAAYFKILSNRSSAPNCVTALYFETNPMFTFKAQKSKETKPGDGYLGKTTLHSFRTISVFAPDIRKAEEISREEFEKEAKNHLQKVLETETQKT